MYIEHLESRIAPATIVNPTTVIFTDIDGDEVTLKMSKPILKDEATANAILQFSAGSVDGEDSISQQLELIDLTSLGAAAKNIGITVSALKTGDGNGTADVGFIDASGIDLGPVKISGDLFSLAAGDSNAKTPGIKSLTLGSFGVNSDSAPIDSPFDTKVVGSVGPIKVTGEFAGWVEAVTGKLDNDGYDIYAPLKTLSVGGDFTGFLSAGSSSSVKISGDMDEGVIFLGRVASAKIGGSLLNGATFWANVKKLTIEGDVVGGDDDSGDTSVEGDIKSAVIKGSVIGGMADESAQVGIYGGIKKLSVTGSIVGGTGEDTGVVIASLVTVQGDVEGRAGTGSGRVEGANVTIKGSVTGGTGNHSGIVAQSLDAIRTDKALNVTIGGTLKGGDNSGPGSLTHSGIIQADDIGKAVIEGSIIAGTNSGPGTLSYSGAVVTLFGIGSLTVKGDVEGNITNRAVIAANSYPSLKKLTVTGDVVYGDILAGLTPMEVFNAETDTRGTGSIGDITIGGNFVASNIVAGAVAGTDGAFGTGDDAVQTFAEPFRAGSIGKVTIKGEVLGTSSVATDHYGIVGGSVKSVKVGGQIVALIAGVGEIESVSDFTVRLV